MIKQKLTVTITKMISITRITLVDRRASLHQCHGPLVESGLCESLVSYLVADTQWSISRGSKGPNPVDDHQFFLFHYELGWKLCCCVKFKKN